MRSPQHAPPRPDLGWLRHRKVEHRHIEYVHPPRQHATPAGPPAPAAALPEAPAPARTAPSLDLSGPLPAPAGPAGPVSRGSPAPARSSEPTRQRSRPRTLPYRRLPSGSTTVLKGRERTVTLTRLQSGVGALQLALAVAPQAGDLALGAVVATDDGATHVVQRAGDAPASPPGPPPLVRLTGSPGGESLLVDLRQVRRLSRALVYGYGPAGRPVAWDGVLTVSTHDGSRVEVPFDLPAAPGTLALLTLYAVHGELVLRGELDLQPGPPEAAAEAYGHHAAWLDGRRPVPEQPVRPRG